MNVATKVHYRTKAPLASLYNSVHQIEKRFEPTPNKLTRLQREDGVSQIKMEEKLEKKLEKICLEDLFSTGMCAKRFSIVDTVEGSSENIVFSKGWRVTDERILSKRKKRGKKVRIPNVHFFAENFDPTKIFYHVINPAFQRIQCNHFRAIKI